MIDFKPFSVADIRLPAGPALRAALLLGAFLFSSNASMAQSNLVSQFEQLRNPAISARKNQKILVVEAKGDPNVIGGRAFGLLFQLYYRIPETPKGRLQGFPRARWPQGLEAAKSEWIGLYGLRVPDTVTQVPEHQAAQGLKASLTTWEYGEVAEILHVGPYSREEPALKRLTEYVRQQGYAILPGGHEEEYVIGPTMDGKGDPEKYVTILRYRVQRNGRK